MKVYATSLALLLGGCASTHILPRPVPSDTVLPPARDIEVEIRAAFRRWSTTPLRSLGPRGVHTDGSYDYAAYFAGWEISGGFESIYYQNLVFVKKKTEVDWSNARVFIQPDGYYAFSGPLHVLEEKGQELKPRDL